MARQYVAVRFTPGDRRTYTYHNDGPPVAPGDTVTVATTREWPYHSLPWAIAEGRIERETCRPDTGKDYRAWEAPPPPLWHCGACEVIVKRDETQPTEPCMRCGSTNWKAGDAPTKQPTPTEADDVIF